MGAASKRLANQIVAAGSVFLMVVGILNFTGACDPLIVAVVGSAIDEDTPDEFMERAREDRARRQQARALAEGRAAGEPAPREEDAEPRAIGAWYPDEHSDRQPSLLTTVDPALIAVGGGALVFGLVGGLAFVLFGMGRSAPAHSSSSAPSSAMEPSGPESDGPT